VGVLFCMSRSASASATAAISISASAGRTVLCDVFVDGTLFLVPALSRTPNPTPPPRLSSTDDQGSSGAVLNDSDRDSVVPAVSIDPSRALAPGRTALDRADGIGGVTSGVGRLLSRPGVSGRLATSSAEASFEFLVVLLTSSAASFDGGDSGGRGGDAGSLTKVRLDGRAEWPPDDVRDCAGGVGGRSGLLVVLLVLLLALLLALLATDPRDDWRCKSTTRAVLVVRGRCCRSSAAAMSGLLGLVLAFRVGLGCGRALCFRGSQCCAASRIGSSDGIDAAYVDCKFVAAGVAACRSGRASGAPTVIVSWRRGQQGSTAIC
jgi:hypothetical protein